MQEYKVTVDSQGTVRWHDLKTDKFHRVDGPAVEYTDGTKSWHLNGKLHRVDGPAIEFSNGGREWYLNGNLHRVDGPAVEYVSGYKSWWLNDVEYNEEQFNAKINSSSCEGREIEIDGKIYVLRLKE